MTHELPDGIYRPGQPSYERVGPLVQLGDSPAPAPLDWTEALHEAHALQSRPQSDTASEPALEARTVAHTVEPKRRFFAPRKLR